MEELSVRPTRAFAEDPGALRNGAQAVHSLGEAAGPSPRAVWTRGGAWFFVLARRSWPRWRGTPRGAGHLRQGGFATSVPPPAYIIAYLRMYNHHPASQRPDRSPSSFRLSTGSC